MGRKKRRLWARHGTVTGVGNWDAGESGPIFLAERIPTLLSCLNDKFTVSPGEAG
jgi:hypothetical protein